MPEISSKDSLSPYACILYAHINKWIWIYVYIYIKLLPRFSLHPVALSVHFFEPLPHDSFSSPFLSAPARDVFLRVCIRTAENKMREARVKKNHPAWTKIKSKKRKDRTKRVRRQGVTFGRVGVAEGTRKRRVCESLRAGSRITVRVDMRGEKTHGG